MQRQIYEVYAKIVDANGSYNTLSGYPKSFDSRNYGNDPDKTFKRAYSDFYEVLGTMYKRDDRQLQFAMIIDGNSGMQIDIAKTGKVEDLPDPEPEPEPEPEE